MSKITIRGLEKAFGRLQVLRGLDLVVPDHSLVAVLGASGCGKTTLLRIIAGFEPADSGTVAIGDEVVEDATRRVPPETRRVGYVPQEGAVFPHLSVGQNVGFGLPRRDRDRDRTIAETLDLVGLTGLERRRPNELSGGQQQRVALARALAPRPRLILLDEPFAALDPATRGEMREEIATLLRSIGTTVMLVTHDQAEALSLTDLVAVIHEGRVVQLDAPRALYAYPASDDVARFVGEANLVSARVESGLAHSALGTLPLIDVRGGGVATDGQRTILVRPEQVVLDPADVGPQSGPTARVVGSTFFGHDTLVTVELSGQPSLRIEARMTSLAPQPGDVVRVRVVGAVIAMPAGDVATPGQLSGGS